MEVTFAEEYSAIHKGLLHYLGLRLLVLSLWILGLCCLASVIYNDVATRYLFMVSVTS